RGWTSTRRRLAECRGGTVRGRGGGLHSRWSSTGGRRAGQWPSASQAGAGGGRVPTNQSRPVFSRTGSESRSGVILDEILEHKRIEVAGRQMSRPRVELEAAIGAPADAGAFKRSLRRPGVSFIAEIKRRSPSGGELRPGASAVDLATIYAAHGAAALSVLTDA